ncbi:MAG: flagellar assembly protein FliW [Alphaproteobacteria bacterium]
MTMNILEPHTSSQTHVQPAFPDSCETRFGKVHFDKEDVITFPEGIYGFHIYRNFTLAYLDSANPDFFRVLLNLEDPDESFMMMPIKQKDTQLIDANDLQEIEDALQLNKEDVEYFAITIVRVLPEAIELSMNLQAPVVVDHGTSQGWQRIMIQSSYPVQHKLELPIS